MSLTMDSQDLCGYLRGLCLVVVVRTTHRAPRRDDFERILRVEIGHEISVFVPAVASFTGLEPTAITSAIQELLGADEDYLRPDNLNLQLGLLCGRPDVVFPFVTERGVDEVALLRPFLDSAEKFVHAAVRVRMQSQSVGSPDGFWRAVVTFLRRVGGNDDVAQALAVATIANVVSDVLFFNSDVPSRTQDEDPALAAQIACVLEELRTIDIAAAMR